MKRIAAFDTHRPVLLAPMAGITEAPFRGICKRFGATLTYTEMVSVKGLHYTPDSRASRALLTFSEAEVPCAVQVFGSDPDMIATQASRIVETYGEKVALIDINMGCPVAKVVGKGEGSALMCDRAHASRIVEATVRAVSLPVTVKFRKGWGTGDDSAVDFAKAMEQAGASALAVHGRTRDQFYRGQADWSAIARVKASVSVPVAGSGDVFSAADVVSMFDATGVDAVMVARGARGNPWIFKEARALIDDRVTLERPTPGERIAVAREHAAALQLFAGDRSVVRMRKHIAWYLSDMPGASHARGRVNACRTYAELDALLLEYAEYLSQPPEAATGSAGQYEHSAGEYEAAHDE